MDSTMQTPLEIFPCQVQAELRHPQLGGKASGAGGEGAKGIRPELWAAGVLSTKAPQHGTLCYISVFVLQSYSLRLADNFDGRGVPITELECPHASNNSSVPGMHIFICIYIYKYEPATFWVNTPLDFTYYCNSKGE